ncbi:MAG: hypothetical protein DRJ34_02815 [Thermoprotei archaeon]|nr:MAG: hypothetical protein DRJ34_02815 [Thermoprotei archaeon]RLE71410.1 MAG: hypothetical protein DRJ45_03740 [Thermoprotei archaeon]
MNMIFIDSTIFIKWISVKGKEISLDEAISGYILEKISHGFNAITTTLVKDEVLIWLSRYRSSKLKQFIYALKALFSLKIVQPVLDDELKAVIEFGKYPLGISDLINLNVMKRLGINIIASSDRGFDEYPYVKRIYNEFQKEPQFKAFLDKLKSRGIKVRYR